MSNEWVFSQLLDSRTGGVVKGEELYQAFKARLMKELVVETHDEIYVLKSSLETIERAARRYLGASGVLDAGPHPDGMVQGMAHEEYVEAKAELGAALTPPPGSDGEGKQ